MFFLSRNRIDSWSKLFLTKVQSKSMEMMRWWFIVNKLRLNKMEINILSVQIIMRVLNFVPRKTEGSIASLGSCYSRLGWGYPVYHWTKYFSYSLKLILFCKIIRLFKIFISHSFLVYLHLFNAFIIQKVERIVSWN